MSEGSEPLYHVTVLSNFARAFDKYTHQYRKGCIAESSYPNESYLLRGADLAIGIAKASRLLNKLRIAGDELLVLHAAVSCSQTHINNRNGIGLIWPSPDLPIHGVSLVGPDGRPGARLTVEDATAKSLELHASSFLPYAELRPRTVSFLPIARGCQASCPFCFSGASVSVDQPHRRFELQNALRWLDFAQSRGAQRAVITGGGEPTLLPWQQLLQLIHACAVRFEKTVLITNGVRLALSPRSEIATQLRQLSTAGVSVLAISRHHQDETVNAELMKLKTATPALLEAYSGVRENLPNTRVRVICALQQGGVKSVADIQNYVTWATSFGVEDVCFKELYVSTSEESVYFSRSSNAWSAKNQVSLSIVHEWAERKSLRVTERLPWGAPIFSGTVGGQPVRIAAYTEPSLFWERSHGVARSWNVMSDGTCLASLEDRRSIIGSPAVNHHADACHEWQPAGTGRHELP